MFCGDGRSGGGGHPDGGCGMHVRGCMASVSRTTLLYEAIAMPLGDRTRGSIPNAVIFIPSFNIIFLLNMNNF